MRKLNHATMWPLIFIALLLGILPSCKKDSTDLQQPYSSPISSGNHPISIDKAKAFFEQLKNSADQQSLGNDSTRMFNLPVVPNWNEAYLSNSLSGRQIVVAPLQDSVFAAANDGRTGLRLLVSNLGGDTLNVEILLFVADSSYFFSNSQDISFNNFSGIYALFDIGFHFKGGVRVVNGAPVGGVKSILRQGQLSPSEEREDGNCFPVFEIIYEPCPITFDDCYETVVIESEDCVNDPWDSNTGGGVSGGGGGGGGGTGTGTGGGTGTPPPFANTHWYFMYFINMPVHLFIQGGGVLPPGLSVEQAEKLRQLNEVCQFNYAQLDWLANNAAMIPIFLAYINNSPNLDSAINTIKNLINSEPAPAEPTNPPISIANPICEEIFTFGNYQINSNVTDPNDPAKMIDLVAMQLNSSYFNFNLPNGTIQQVHVSSMSIEAFGPEGISNPSCLSAAPTLAAAALNQTVSQIQTLLNNGTISDPSKQLKGRLVAGFDNAFRAQVINCGGDGYTTNVAYKNSLGSLYNGVPVINCDATIPVCD